MGFDLKSEIMLSRIVCDKCKQKEKTIHSCAADTYNIMFDIKKENKDISAAAFKIKVDIKRIIICREAEGKYSAKAKMRVKCPKCEERHILEDVIEVPKIVFEEIKKCDQCGTRMEYLPDVIEIEDNDENPILNASGILRCCKCNNKERYDKFTGEVIKSEAREVWIASSGRKNRVIS